MQIETFTERQAAAQGNLRLFSLHLDFPAAVCARWAASQISRHAAGLWKTSAEMWKLDSLAASGPISKMAAEGAAAADVFIVALSSVARRETELVEWLDSLAAGRTERTTTGLFIGLLGGEEGPADEMDWILKQFLRTAQRTDRDFIWHWMEPCSMTDGGWLKKSADALLARKQPAWDVPSLPKLARQPARSFPFSQTSPIRL
jgi:hypothetical protein